MSGVHPGSNRTIIPNNLIDEEAKADLAASYGAFDSSCLPKLRAVHLPIHFLNCLSVQGHLGQRWANGHTHTVCTRRHVYIKTKTHPAAKLFSLPFGGLNEMLDSNKSDQTSKTLNATDTHNLSLLWLRDYQKARDWVDVHSSASLSLYNLYNPLSISDPSISHLTAF